MELKEETQKLLESWDTEDVEHIKKALKAYETAELLGRGIKYLSVTALAFLVFVTDIKDHLKIFFSYIKGP